MPTAPPPAAQKELDQYQIAAARAKLFEARLVENQKRLDLLLKRCNAAKLTDAAADERNPNHERGLRYIQLLTIATNAMADSLGNKVAADAGVVEELEDQLDPILGSMK